MYPNLNAELARLGWSRKVLADKLEVRYATILDKLNGKYPLTYDECVRIKNLMGADIPLEVLFFTEWYEISNWVIKGGIHYE